jgi:hypothetical protein
VQYIGPTVDYKFKMYCRPYNYNKVKINLTLKNVQNIFVVQNLIIFYDKNNIIKI